MTYQRSAACTCRLIVTVRKGKDIYRPGGISLLFHNHGHKSHLMYPNLTIEINESTQMTNRISNIKAIGMKKTSFLLILALIKTYIKARQKVIESRTSRIDVIQLILGL